MSERNKTGAKVVGQNWVVSKILYLEEAIRTKKAHPKVQEMVDRLKVILIEIGKCNISGRYGANLRPVPGDMCLGELSDTTKRLFGVLYERLQNVEKMKKATASPAELGKAVTEMEALKYIIVKAIADEFPQVKELLVVRVALGMATGLKVCGDWVLMITCEKRDEIIELAAAPESVCGDPNCQKCYPAGSPQKADNAK